MDLIWDKDFKRYFQVSSTKDGNYVVEIPGLPGCVSKGKTRKEAMFNIQKAIELHIESSLRDF